MYSVGLLLCTAHVCSAENALTSPEPRSESHNSSGCAAAVFLTLEDGRIAGVDWVERKGDQLHSREILTQSRIIDDTIELRPDETASHSTVVLSVVGETPEEPITRDLGSGAVYWSDMVVSSIEQVVRRSRLLEAANNSIATQNLYHDRPGRRSGADRLDGLGGYRQQKAVPRPDG